MRILHVVTLHMPTHDFGGPTRVALHLAREQRRRGHDAVVVALADGFDGELPREVDGVPVRLFRARHVVPRYYVAGMTSPALLRRAGRYVRDADLVHVHLLRDLVTLPVAVRALAAGTPLVLQTHGMVDPTRVPAARLVDVLATRRVLRCASAVLALTEQEARDTAAVVAPRPMAPTYRLVNGVPPAEPREPRRDGPPTVLFLARVQERKRPADFVRAIPHVRRRYPTARFVLAGPDTGRLADELLSLADGLGVRDAVEYVGPLDHPDVLARMRASDVYVLPSVVEPLGVTVLEAMSVGLPVVVTRTCGLAPDVAAAGAGRVIDSQDGDRDNGPLIAEAVCALLDPDAAHAAGTAGLRLVRERFALEAVVERLDGVYRQVLDVHRSAGS